MRAANTLSGRELYAWRHFSPDGTPVHCSTGLKFDVDGTSGSPEPLDQLFVFAAGNPAPFDHRPTFAWLRALARRQTLLAGVSGGTFALARAGVLDGHRCTVHWEHLASLGEEFPRLILTGSLYEVDGRRMTCAGGTAALDMMCESISVTHGPALGYAVSDWFLHTEIRQADAPQKMAKQRSVGPVNPRLINVLEKMETSTHSPIKISALASAEFISARQLERLFRNHFGCTIHNHYMDLRLKKAQTLVRETTLPMLEIALACGFSGGSHFAKIYKRKFNLTPSADRRAQRTVAS